MLIAPAKRDAVRPNHTTQHCVQYCYRAVLRGWAFRPSYGPDDMQILFDQAKAWQPEMSLDFPELALRVIAQAAAPCPGI
jgi:hypothetical protein